MQLNCIEAKLDAILQRLESGTDAGDALLSTETKLVSSSPIPAPGGACSAGVESRSPDGSADASDPVPAALSSATGSYRPGGIAVAHAAPTRGHPLGEIPADSIGGFLYTGGPIRLTDLSDRGARYAGPAGIQLQGWLRATETGRYQNTADLQLRFGKGAIFALRCTFSAWL